MGNKESVKEEETMNVNKQETKEAKKAAKDLKKEEKKAAKAEKKKNKTPMDAAKKKKVIKRSIIGGVAGVFVLFLVVSNIAAANAKPMVQVVTVGKTDLNQTLSTSGTVVSGDVKIYFAPVSVEIGAINAAAGGTVKKGEAVITYEETAMANAKRTAELALQANEGNYSSSVQKNNESWGDLSEANVNLDVLDTQITDIDAYIQTLQKKVNDKKAALAQEGALLQISLIDWADQPDSDEYENLQKLVQQNSYEQVNNAEIRAWQDEINKYSNMLANCKEYKAEMKSQKASADGTKLNQGGKAEMEARAEMEKISSQKTLDAINKSENGELAEFDGVVTEMNAVEGKTPAVGEQLFKLESTEDVKINISVTKYDLEKLAVGQKATVTVAGKDYEGEVNKIDKMATKNASGAAVVNTEVKILNPDENIVLGVEAKVKVNTAEVKQALTIPVSAVNTDTEGDFVYVIVNGIVEKRAVKAGISSDLDIQIVEGLAEGDQIMSETVTGVEEGMAVTAVPAE